MWQCSFFFFPREGPLTLLCELIGQKDGIWKTYITTVDVTVFTLTVSTILGKPREQPPNKGRKISFLIERNLEQDHAHMRGSFLIRQCGSGCKRYKLLHGSQTAGAQEHRIPVCGNSLSLRMIFS